MSKAFIGNFFSISACVIVVKWLALLRVTREVAGSIPASVFPFLQSKFLSFKNRIKSRKFPTCVGSAEIKKHFFVVIFGDSLEKRCLYLNIEKANKKIRF